VVIDKVNKQIRNKKSIHLIIGSHLTNGDQRRVRTGADPEMETRGGLELEQTLIDVAQRVRTYGW